MKLDVYRYSSSKESTLGLLFIDQLFQCHTLEDEFRNKKVFGETRIPADEYVIKLRKEGGHHKKYAKKFGDFHKGMLHLQDVPGFTWILIHIGNTDDDTAGCLLTGNGVNNNQITNGMITDSTGAYKKMYDKVSTAILAGEQVTIEYHDDIC